MGVIDWLRGGKTLYFPGRFMKENAQKEFEDYKAVFYKLGIDFSVLQKNNLDCGFDALHSGHKKRARKIAKRNFAIFKENSVNKIITSSPECYYMFKEFYPAWIREWNIEVEHVTVTILKALNKREIEFDRPEAEREPVTYQDPCYLGRHSGIYEEPRKVIELLGGRIIEMPSNKENAMCCGACGGVYQNFPKLAKKIAEKRAAEIPEGAVKIISPSELCYLNLKQCTDKSIEFSTFVLSKLRAMRV